MTPQQKLQKKLSSVGLPFDEIQCYGSQITVTVRSIETSQRWVSLLSKFASIRGTIETVVENKTDKTPNKSTYHKAYRVYATL